LVHSCKRGVIGDRFVLVLVIRFVVRARVGIVVIIIDVDWGSISPSKGKPMGVVASSG